MSYENINPVNTDGQGLKTLRNIKDCPVPKESTRINSLMEKIAEMDATDETIQAIAEGVAVIMQADRFCEKQISKRKVLDFSEDDELDKMTKTASKLVEEIQEAQKQHALKVQELRELLGTRWELAIKKYGLNTKERLYAINDRDGRIDLIDLECSGCKGATRMRKTRQKVDEALTTLSRKEEDDDSNGKGTKQGDPQDD